MAKLRMTLSIILSFLGIYSLITRTTGSGFPYILLVMGAMLIIMGVIEFQRRQPNAFTLFLAAGFSLFVGVHTM